MDHCSKFEMIIGVLFPEVSGIFLYIFGVFIVYINGPQIYVHKLRKKKGIDYMQGVDLYVTIESKKILIKQQYYFFLLLLLFNDNFFCCSILKK